MLLGIHKDRNNEFKLHLLFKNVSSNLRVNSRQRIIQKINIFITVYCPITMEGKLIAYLKQVRLLLINQTSCFDSQRNCNTEILQSCLCILELQSEPQKKLGFSHSHIYENSL